MPYHRQWVVSHWTGNYVISVNPLNRVTEVEQRTTTRALFVLLSEFRNGDRRAGTVFRDVHQALHPESVSVFGGLAGGLRESESRARIAEAVERAVRLGQLSIVADVRPIVYVAPRPLAPALGPSETTSASESIHFIELELVDRDEKPVGGEAYSIKLPDGRTRTGRLDSNGRATVTGIKDPGSCQVSFPNLDVSAWA